MNIQLDYRILIFKLLNSVNPWLFLPDRLGISYILYLVHAFSRSKCLTAWLCTVMLCSLFSLWFTFFAMQVLWKRLTFRKIKYKRNPTTALNLRDALRWQNKCAVSNEMAWGCFAYFCFMDEFACTKESLFSFKERGDGQKICCLIQFLLVFIH